jgi:hypothetical protein
MVVETPSSVLARHLIANGFGFLRRQGPLSLLFAKKYGRLCRMFVFDRIQRIINNNNNNDYDETKQSPISCFFLFFFFFFFGGVDGFY